MKQLKYAIQNVIRGKGSNIVKVVSITLGLLVSVILIAKVAYELSYDNFYRDNEQLYVVKTGGMVENRFMAITFILLLLRLPGTFPLKWKVLRQ